MTKRFSQIFAGSASVMATISLTAQSAYADGAGMFHHDGDWGWGWGWGNMMFGSSMMFITLGLVVFFVVLLGRWFSDGPDRAEKVSPVKSAEETLRQRFAVGEIDEAEFNERMRVLTN